MEQTASTQWGKISQHCINVFDISSGPDADLCGNFSRAESSSPSFLPFFFPVPHSSLCVSYIPLSFHYFLLPFSFSQFSLALLLIDLPSDQKKCGSKSHICCYHIVISAMWTKWIDEDNIFIRLCVCLCVHVADQSIRQSEVGILLKNDISKTVKATVFVFDTCFQGQSRLEFGRCGENSRCRCSDVFSLKYRCPMPMWILYTGLSWQPRERCYRRTQLPLEPERPTVARLPLPRLHYLLPAGGQTRVEWMNEPVWCVSERTAINICGKCVCVLQLILTIQSNTTQSIFILCFFHSLNFQVT